MLRTVQIPKQEYDDMFDYMERMRETIEVLSSQETIKKLSKAVERIEILLLGSFRLFSLFHFLPKH